jgi:hypothetical protein
VATTRGHVDRPHAHRKLDAIVTRVGETGSPILVDAVSYVDGRVASTLDSEELTIVLADVVSCVQSTAVAFAVGVRRMQIRVRCCWAAVDADVNRRQWG